MLIDWFTITAQIINFLILVFLLKRFLYKPIIAAMDARQQQIDANLHAAEEQRLLAEQERTKLAARSEELERGKAEQLKLAVEEAEATRKTLTEKARSEIADQRATWMQTLTRDQDSLRRDLTENTQDAVFATLRAAFRDMAGVEMEDAMALKFVGALHAMDSKQKISLREDLTAVRSPVVIRSVFKIGDVARAKIEEAVRSELGVTCAITFQQRPDLICGIEMAADGTKTSWTFAHYVSEMQRSVKTAMEKVAAKDIHIVVETEQVANGR